MEIALFIIIIILLLYNKSQHKNELNQVKDLLSRNLDEILLLKNKLEKFDHSSSDSSIKIIDDEIHEEPIPNQPSFFDSLEIKDIIQETEVSTPYSEYNTPTTPISSPPPIPIELEQHHNENVFNREPEEPKLSWYAKFKQNNPDLEKFIGENLINKIGIVILILGISFFVKYAIDKDWINETGRVGIGILAGSIILGVAHKLRSKFKAFSSVLVAGAIAVFYFTIGIAFHDYQLFSQPTAFGIMVAITLFSVFVSIAYNRQELGVMSTIAGFAVPFMVSTGEGNYHVLLTYLLILNTGMLIISYYKRWFIVNFTSLISTILVIGGWYTTLNEPPAYQLQHTLIYCTILYFIFMIAFVVNNIVNKNKFAMYEMGALLTSTALYFAIGTHIINSIAPAYLGIFTLILGISNILFATVIYKKYKLDQNIIYVLIGLALTLATLTIPIQFSGNYITIFWACEAVLLFWLTQKSKMKGFLIAGVIVQCLALGSLLIDQLEYFAHHVPYVFAFNLHFITSLIVIGSCIYTYKLFHAYNFKYYIYGVDFDYIKYRKVIFNITLILAYLLPLNEIYYQADAKFYNEGSLVFFPYLYHMLFTSGIIYFTQKKHNITTFWSTILVLFNAFFYIILAYNIPLLEKTETFFDKVNFPYAFSLHYITILLLIYQVWSYYKQCTSNIDQKLAIKSFAPWFLGFSITYLVSAETNIVFLFNSISLDDFNETREFVIKVIFPVLWGIISFAFLIFGIKNNLKVARIIALVLLGITILKLFVYDIQDVSETGKIIAFILLGVLILVISFVYQKIKKLVVDNEKSDK